MPDQEFDPSLDSVEVNAARLMSHVFQKGFQAGGVLSTAVVAPAVLFLQRRKGVSPRNAIPAVVAAAYRTVLATTTLTVGLGVAKVAGLEDRKAGLEDRVYRLHYNQGQNRADLFAKVGTAAGAAAAAALLPVSAPALVSGGAMGAAAALAAHVGTKRKPAE